MSTDASTDAATSASPLLEIDGLFDDRQRSVIERVSAAERAHILALPSDDPLDEKRRFRVEATRGELMTQPDAIRRTLARNESELATVAKRLATGGFDRLFLVGAGDSLAVMIAARSALESMLGVPCEPVQSLEFAYYQRSTVSPSSAVIALSSSGETTRTVEAALVAQQAGAFTIGLTNTVGSTLDVESENTLLIDATRVGWPTQSSTAALALLLQLAVLVGDRRGASAATELAAELATAPELMQRVLDTIDVPIAEIAAGEATRSMYLFTGGGPNWAAAIVGAAKVKECTPDHAVSVQVEEYHHYNSQKAGEPLFMLVPSGPSVQRAIETGTDAHRWGGQLFVATTEGQTAFDDLADRVLHLPAIDERISPLLYLLPAQLVGYHLGMAQFALAKAALGATDV
jgi:glucosamine 6-phosphate synthetase-like amidotransferase/phosphosugar isomerase protein